MELGPVSREAWFEVAAASPEASFYHSPIWARVALADPLWEDGTLGGRLADGARFVYPLLRRPRRRAPRLARAISTYAGCYGGPVAERPLRPEEAKDLHAEVARRHLTELRVVLGPRSSEQRYPARFSSRADSTLIVPLEGGPDAVLAGFSQGHRRAFRRGEREGVTIREGAGPDDHRVYEEMYRANLERWGEQATSRYSTEMVLGIGAVAAEHPTAVRLWFAEYEGRVVSGLWAFEWGDQVVLWHSASYDVRVPMLSPAISLYGHVLCDAAARGLRELDFNPSGGHERVVDFKRRFGARELPVVRLSASRRWAQAALAAIDRAAPLVRGRG